MEDWEVSVEAILAVLLWLAGFALILVDIVGGPDIGEMGLFVAGLGLVLTLRRTQLNATLDQKNAFQVGRDYERGHTAEVTRIR